MKEFRIEYGRIPTNYNPAQVMFIEAENKDDAENKAKIKLERTTGLQACEFWITKVEVVDV